MNASLYEITREYLEALDHLEIDEETGEILNAEELDKLAGAFDEKVESVACYIKNLTAFAGDLKEEEANLAKRRKSAEKKVDYLKTFLSSCMDAAGRDKFNGVKANVSFRKSVAVRTPSRSKLSPSSRTRRRSKRQSKTGPKCPALPWSRTGTFRSSKGG